MIFLLHKVLLLHFNPFTCFELKIQLQARSLECKQLWVKELREVIQKFQFGTLRERSKAKLYKTLVTTFKGATSRYFEPFSATCKISFNLKGTTKN